KVIGGRRRNLVIDDPPEDITAHHLEPGGVRILNVLAHPQSAALVEGHAERLLDDRLRENLIEAQIVRDLERLGRVRRRQLGGRLVVLAGLRGPSYTDANRDHYGDEYSKPFHGISGSRKEGRRDFMRTRILGKTGIAVSELAFGSLFTSSLGPGFDE